MTAFPPYQLDGLPLSDTNRLKMLREDEVNEIPYVETRAPQLVSLVRTMGGAEVSLVRTLAGAEIQEAVTAHDKNTDSAREPVRCGEEEQVLSRG
jgi:hypothetical protein